MVVRLRALENRLSASASITVRPCLPSGSHAVAANLDGLQENPDNANYR